MKEIVIVITMLFANPSDPSKDAIEIESHNGKPVHFSEMEECFKYVQVNFEQLKAFANKEFSDKPGALVKQILCVETDKVST